MSGDTADGSAGGAAPGRPPLRSLPAAFWQVLVNNLFALLTNFTVSAAVSYFTFLQTRSVVATGLIAAIDMVMTAATGIWFGTLVDRYRKKTMMLASSAASLALFSLALALFVAIDPADFTRATDRFLWVFILVLKLGAIAGNIRTIAMSTVVTLLVPAPSRDRANGVVGSLVGVAYLVTSVISGLLLGFAGMLYVLVPVVVCTVLVIVHLGFVRLREPVADTSEKEVSRTDLRGTIATITAVPGLMALIAFTLMNNFLHGILVALVDPYGLSLVSVQVWGVLAGSLFSFMLLGSALVARYGLGPDPLKTMLGCNIALWATMAVFTLRSSILLLSAGIAIYLLLVPFIEAAEQTILQEMVPYERQGRVFGFAQSLEQTASPLSAFLVSPLAQFVFIPLMSTGAGAQLIGSWYGTGPERGIALLYTMAGVLGLVLTIIATRSRRFRNLAATIKQRRVDGLDAQPRVEPAG